MTAPELSQSERVTFARFECADDAPESLRSRVAAAIHVDTLGKPWGQSTSLQRRLFLDAADHAIDIVTGRVDR